MNYEIFAAITPGDILEEIDLMLPGLIDQSEISKIQSRNFKFRQSRGKGNQKKSSRALGISLVILGAAMLIPGPVDLAFAAAGGAIGGFLGGPAGAATGAMIGLAIYNIAAVIVITIGIVIIIGSFIGF